MRWVLCIVEIDQKGQMVKKGQMCQKAQDDVTLKVVSSSTKGITDKFYTSKNSV